MKRFTLLLMSVLCAAGMATAAEELTLTQGWNCSIGTTEIGEIPQYPAQATISGQWQNIKICTETFDATEWVRYKIVFGEPATFEEGQIQVMVRNAAEAQSYTGHYQEIPGGATVYENTLSGLPFEGGDTQVALLGIQNRTTSEVTFVINDVVLYKADGTEWHTNLANDWGGTVKKLSEGEVIENYTFGQWGTLMHDFGEQVVPADGDVHHFTVESSEPLPAGFQWKIIRGSNDGDAIYFETIVEGQTTATVDLTAENIRKNADDAINYYTGVAIQAMKAATLPIDVKMYREIRYANGAIVREQLPVIAETYGDDAKVIDPNPGEEVGPNGLPVLVTLSSQWQDIKLWKTDFDVTEYPSYRIVLKEPLADPADIQMYYRTESHGSQGAVYVPWETDEDMMVTISDDGREMYGDFDIDALEGDNVVLRFALQNRTGNTVNMIIRAVYLINEDGDEVPTEGLVADGWNAGKLTPVGGSYDENGRIWDAIVEYYSSNSALGYYSGTVDEGTYHKVTFYTEEPLPAGIMPMAYNLSWDQNWNMSIDAIETQVEGWGTNELTVKIPRSYQYLVVQYFGEEAPAEPIRVHFTKIVREVFVDEVLTGIADTQTGSSATVKRVDYYNAAGAKIDQPTKGVVIMRQTLSDGTVRSRKLMF